MKIGPVTKLDKRNTATLKKADDDIMSANYEVIIVFLIYGKFGAILEPDSGHIVRNFYILLNRNLLSYKK